MSAPQRTCDRDPANAKSVRTDDRDPSKAKSARMGECGGHSWAPALNN
jgi:hypothetical protein